MTTQLADPSVPVRPKPTREEGLVIAERRKAARGRRTGRIRRAIAVVSVAAFIGPFAVIYTQLAEGHDPALANVQAAAVVQDEAAAATTTGSTPDSTTGTTQSAPAAVTTQQS